MANKRRQPQETVKEPELGTCKGGKYQPQESQNNGCRRKACNRACPLVVGRKGIGSIRSTRIKLKTFAHKRKESVPRVEQDVLQ
jgi:hypothetical protein